MKKKTLQTVALILINPDNKILLQLRDNKEDIPFPNTWCIPGGQIDKKELPERAMRREMLEELEYKLPNLHFFNTYHLENYKMKIFVFICKTPIKTSKEFKLHEGQSIKFFSRKEIQALNTAWNIKKIINDYFNSKA